MKLQIKLQTLLVGIALSSGPLSASPIQVASYEMLNGQAHSYSYLDKSYNGTGDRTASLAPLSGGTGILTDGVVGVSDFTANLGHGPAYEWVGWARNSFHNDPLDYGDTIPVITFDFSGLQVLNSISLFVDNPDGQPNGTESGLSGIGIFDTAFITFSTDGVNYGSQLIYTTSAAERADPSARYVTINLGGISASHVQVHLTRTDNWVFLSEVQFDGGTTTTGTSPTPEPGSLLLSGAALAGLLLARKKLFQI
jgi:hypothetical protein